MNNIAQHDIEVKHQDIVEVPASLPERRITPEDLIAQAIANNTPVEALEKLLTMREKLQAERARNEYFEALSAFQSECPEIEKKKDGGKTASGYVAYKYASLDQIVAQIKALLHKHGFSYSFKSEVEPERVAITCEARHKGGHTEVSRLVSPMSTRTQVMSAPQQVAATVTFLKRYAFCNVFGIMTADEDVDGVDLAKKTVSPPAPPKHPEYANDFQKKRLVELGITLGYTAESIKEYLATSLKVQSFDTIPFGVASRTITAMEKKKAQKKEQTQVEAAGKTHKDPEKDLSFTKVSCRQCRKEIEMKDAYNEWFCSKECNEMFSEANYGKRIKN